MKTRLQRKRRRISEDQMYMMEEPIHRIKRKRGRPAKNKMSGNLKIILRKISPTKYEVDTSNTEVEKCMSITLIKPRLFLPRINVATFANLGNHVEDPCIADDKLDQNISRQEDTKRFEFTSIERNLLNDGVRGYETITTSNILSFRSESLYIPIVKNNDAITKKCDNSRRNDMFRETARQRVLRDMKNVIDSNGKSSCVSGKIKPTMLSPARGRENTEFSKLLRKKKKVDRFEHFDETPSRNLSRKIRDSAKLVVSLTRMNPEKNVHVPCHHQVVEEEFMETLSKTEKQFDNSITEIQKNVKVRKTRGIAVRSCRLGVQQNRTEIIREIHVEKVKNVSLSELENHVLTLPGRRITRNLSSGANCSKNQVTLSKNKTVHFRENSESHLVSCQTKKSHKSVKKKLNVSFKEQTDIIDDLSFEESGSKRKMPTRKKVITSTPYVSSKNTCSSEPHDCILDPFHGFPASVDLSSHSEFCSFILNSVESSPTEKPKKRMTKVEAAKKSEIANLCKKALENSQRPMKTSQRLAIKKMKKELQTKFNATAVMKNKKILTPYIRLNKLNESDISSYKITPLREERLPLKPKTEHDYGIDDVNTDDSTDDEDCPKKIVPQWAQQIQKNFKNSFNPQEAVPRSVIQRWMRPPKLAVPLKQYLFKRK